MLGLTAVAAVPIPLVGAPGSFDSLADHLGTSRPVDVRRRRVWNCHGLSGEGAVVGPDIWGLNAVDIRDVVRKGGNGMPSFDGGRLTDEQIDAVVTYLNGLRQQAGTR